MVLAFADSFGSKTSLQAEALALYMGVKLCCMLELSNITIECDSAVLIDVLNGHAATPWKLKTVLKKLDRYRHRFKNIVHCYREANRVADALTSLGHSCQHIQIFWNIRLLKLFCGYWSM